MNNQVRYYLVGSKLNHSAFIDTTIFEKLTDDKVVSRLQQWFAMQYNKSRITKEQFDKICGEIQMGDFKLYGVRES